MQVNSHALKEIIKRALRYALFGVALLYFETILSYIVLGGPSSLLFHLAVLTFTSAIKFYLLLVVYLVVYIICSVHFKAESLMKHILLCILLCIPFFVIWYLPYWGGRLPGSIIEWYDVLCKPTIFLVVGVWTSIKIYKQKLTIE